MSGLIKFSLHLRAGSGLATLALLFLQPHFPHNPYLSCDNGGWQPSASSLDISTSSGGSTSLGSPVSPLSLSSHPEQDSKNAFHQLVPPPRNRVVGGALGGRGSKGKVGVSAEMSPFTGPLPKMVKVPGARSEGAFAVVAAGDDDSVRRALAVCYQLGKMRTAYDRVVATPDAMGPRLEAQVRAVGALPVTLGRAPYPPKFNPKRPQFRVCWHRLRLFLLSPYRAVCALDSDVLVLNNVDFLIQKVLNQDDAKPRWFVARDETPLCDDCKALPSGAPNAGVFAVNPDPAVYARLLHRSRFWSPWFGFEWSYSEQELLSIFFLVEAEKHGVEVSWLDNGVNSFACKLRCPNLNSASNNQQPPSILHFVGVPKPTEVFVAATRRSAILNSFHPAFPEFTFMRNHYVTWFERYVGAMKLAKAPRPKLLWHEHLMSLTKPPPQPLLSTSKATTGEGGGNNQAELANFGLGVSAAGYSVDGSGVDYSPLWLGSGGGGNQTSSAQHLSPLSPLLQQQQRLARSQNTNKNFVAYVDVPRTGGAAVMKMLMRALYGDKWFYEECKASQASGSSSAPPLCATYGDWVRPKDRKGADIHKCTVLGCGLGHLTLPRVREAIGPDLFKRTFSIVILRHPVDLFVSEYHYIASEVKKQSPSLQFVQDKTLREQMRNGMTLRQYAAYPHSHHDWHGSSLNRQAFYLTGQTAGGGAGKAGKKQRGEADLLVDDQEARRVLLRAIVTLRSADFVGVVEDLGRLVVLLRCSLGVGSLLPPTPEVMRSVLGAEEARYVRPTNDSDLIRRIESLNRVDMELHEFGSELFDVRWANLGVMRKSGFDFC